MELNKIYNEDCLEGIRKIEDKTIQMTVTSPPYFNLRTYTDSENEVGRERNVDEYINNLKNIFLEVFRVTKDDGSCYVNISDTYGKNGSLLCVPDKFKLMMISLGWVCKNEIIWHKPNAMPSSAKNRFTNDYEKIYFFTKKRKYKFNTQYEERLSKVSNKNKKRGTSKYLDIEHESKHRQGMNNERGNKLIEIRKDLPPQDFFVSFLRSRTSIKQLCENTDLKKSTIEHWFRRDTTGFSYPTIENWNEIKYLVDDWSKDFSKIDNGLTKVSYEYDDIDKNSHKGRIQRTLWSIPTKKLKEKHFAPYPKELIETPIKASTDENDVVLDPFMGSGTTGVVAVNLNRNYIGFEISEEYVEIANERIKNHTTQTDIFDVLEGN